MNDRFSRFVFRTRGLYMFVALAVSMGIKYFLGGTTTLPLLILGLFVLAVVQAFRMYSASFLWGRQAVAQVEADFLCTSGPYAYVRNPLYMGNFLIGIGLSIAINEWYAYVLFMISYVAVYSIVIPYEERFLEEKFRDVYREYKAHTGRLLPKLKGYKGSVNVTPNYRAGVLGEIHVPIILAIFLFVIFLLFVK